MGCWQDWGLGAWAVGQATILGGAGSSNTMQLQPQMKSCKSLIESSPPKKERETPELPGHLCVPVGGGVCVPACTPSGLPEHLPFGL